MFEAHHKISRKLRKLLSCFDVGRPDAAYYLPDDINNYFVKDGPEPTSLLQFLQCTMIPNLLRISIPNELYSPQHLISHAKFNNPVYSKESRKTYDESI